MPKTVMVIEDDTDILEVMTYILQSAGYDVVSAAGSELLTGVNDHYPDLILLDNRLPEGLGIEICKRYKAIWKESGISACPVVIVSADHELGTRTADYDADGFLEKPFEIQNYLAMVKKFVRN